MKDWHFWFSLLSVLATIAIAINAYISYKLSKKIHLQSEEDKKRVNKIFAATMFSNVIEANEGVTKKRLKQLVTFWGGLEKFKKTLELKDEDMIKLGLK